MMRCHQVYTLPPTPLSNDDPSVFYRRDMPGVHQMKAYGNKELLYDLRMVTPRQRQSYRASVGKVQ